MDYVSDANELVRRLRAFAFGGAAPEALAERLQALPGVQADQICDGAEILYAHRDLLDPSGLRLAGELFSYALHQGWTTFNQGDRSARIVALARRDLGETGGDVAGEADEWPAPQIARRADGADWRDTAAAAQPG